MAFTPNVANVKMRACEVSWGGDDLGLLDGNIEVTMEEQMFDVTAHQYGTQVLGQIRTGKNVEVTLSLKESDVERLKEMIQASGGTHTPSVGTSPTAVTGWGTSKNFKGTFEDAKRLVLHPRDMGASKAEDLCFWLAYPVLESLTFSGEESQTIPVTFKIFNDVSKPEAVSMFIIGDHSQTAFDDVP